jgi:diguanylate cyclase (GGDEF)-like protein
VRLGKRLQVAAHVVLATGLISALALTGYVPLAIGLSLMLVIVVIWAMAISHVAYLEAAEEQGAQLHQLVRRDPLTGLGNRRALDEQVEYELQRARRSGLGMAVVSLDLNGFKALNDELGHSAGDDLLRHVADLLRGAVRESDTVVRQGGDEFCVLLPETDAARAEKLSETLRAAVRRASPDGYPISTGVGIAVFPTDGESPAALLRVADARLIQDKRGSSRSSRSTRATSRGAMGTSMRPASS